jgi:hypothetical protein
MPATKLTLIAYSFSLLINKRALFPRITIGSLILLVAKIKKPDTKKSQISLGLLCLKYLVLATTYFRDQLPSNYRQRYSV